MTSHPMTPAAQASAHAGASPVPSPRNPVQGTGEDRTWIVELPAGLRLLNANDRLHHMAKAAIVKDIRTAAWALARQASIPALQRAHVVCEYRPPDRRRRDVHNLTLSAKAAIDGLVDAGVLRDDSDEYLVGPDMRCGDVVRHGQLVLYVIELDPGQPLDESEVS